MGRKGVFAGAAVMLAAMLAAGCLLQQPQKKQGEDVLPPQHETVQGSEPDITVFMHETGEKKTMKMEEYIAGVIAGEMKNDWPVAALGAQAILARTFTLQAMEEKGGAPARGTQASTDIKEFQAYDAKAINDNVRKAVEMTRGLVVTYQGKPIHAWFHSSAGGITAMAKEGLAFKEEEPPYIESVQSPDELAPDDVKNWSAQFSKKDLLAAVSQEGKSIHAVESLEIGEKGPSGRTLTLLLNKSVKVAAAELRMALGAEKLKSTLLDDVSVVGDHVLFTGKGFGHGVGLSQWGANKLATDGKSPQEIIGHYFKNVNMEKRWN